MAERKLKPYFKDGKLPITAWRKERERLEPERSRHNCAAAQNEIEL